MEDQPPQWPGDLHHAPVPQKLRQVAPQGCSGRCFGRAQVDQQHGAARGTTVDVGGFGGEAHRS